jgi:hypothetical protein
MELKDARTSLPSALHLLLRLGLPIAAVFVAINPIWGFSWYFNTESWASGVYQKMSELRVDPWRVAMVDAVLKAVGGDLRALRLALTGRDRGPELWAIVAALPREETLRRIDAAL